MRDKDEVSEEERPTDPEADGWIMAQFRTKTDVTKKDAEHMLLQMYYNSPNTIEMPFFEQCEDSWVVVFYREKPITIPIKIT